MEQSSDANTEEEETLLRKRQEYTSLLKGIGITLLVLSLVAIIATITALGVSYYSWWTPYLNTGAGIWGNIMVIPLGILLILSAKQVSRCLVVWTFTWAVVAAFFQFVTLLLSFFGGIYNSNIWRPEAGAMATHIGLFAVSMVQMILSLFVATRFGKLCCSSSYGITCSDMWSGCCLPRRSEYQLIYQPRDMGDEPV